jgi:steroid 5-alpha reductase family enzyme
VTEGQDAAAAAGERSRGFRWIGIAYAVAIVVSLVAGGWAHARHPDLHPLWIVAIADFAGTVAIFAFSFAFGNSSFYDAYWSVAPPVIAVYLALVPEASGGDRARLLLVITLVTFWAVRLTWNWARGWTGLAHEDWRYVDLKTKSGKAYWGVSFGGIHLFPTIQVFLACLPLYPALGSARPLGFVDALAALVTTVGIFFELVADNQLRRFVRSKPPRGRILDTGLWSLSRHPNYFGEMSFWWGIWLFGVAADPGWWWTVIGPVAITGMFRFASLPMIETRMAERREGWAEYAARVPLVIPRPPRRVPGAG